MSDSYQLDDIDREILELLKRNGRESAAEIAKKVHRDQSAVKRRIDKLEKSGVIKKYTILIDPERIEGWIDAYIMLRFHDGTDMEAAMDELILHPEVREVLALAGNLDALLRVRVKTTDELGRFAMSLRKLEYLRGEKTHVVFGRRYHGAIPSDE